MPEELVAITIVFIVIGLPVICGTLIALAKMNNKAGGRSRKDLMSAKEEARLIQEMHQTLNKLEDRIESLETIVLEREQSEKPART